MNSDYVKRMDWFQHLTFMLNEGIYEKEYGFPEVEQDSDNSEEE